MSDESILIVLIGFTGLTLFLFAIGLGNLGYVENPKAPFPEVFDTDLTAANFTEIIKLIANFLAWYVKILLMLAIFNGLCYIVFLLVVML